MTITSQTTTQTTHRATLTGGITVSINPATFGAMLTLFESGRAMTLALTPEQVAEMADWEGVSERVNLFLQLWQPRALTHSGLIWQDVRDFVLARRQRNGLTGSALLAGADDDIATLRALARAYQETQP